MRKLTRRGILLSAAALPGAAWAAGPETVLPVHGPLPAIEWATADGTRQSLDTYKGRAVLLNFWATWCVPCVAELPALDSLARLLPALAVLPLSSDRGGASAVQSFYAQHRIEHLPILIDPRGEAARRIGARGIPTTVVLAADGRPVGLLEGAAPWDGAAMVAWLKETAGAT